MTRRKDLTIAVIAAAVGLTAAALAVVFLTQHGRAGSGATGDAVAAGRAIFRTGRDLVGVPIPRTGTVGMGMMAGGCAACHGVDGHGRTTMMYASPNITYANLTDPAGMLQPDATRGPTYTDATLRRAIVAGIDPNGDQLQAPMPRWQLSDAQWTELLACLKALR
jgi:hypothetical protein